jgi:hypothetical protein
MPIAKVKCKWDSGRQIFYDAASGSTIFVLDGPNLLAIRGSGAILCQRFRNTIAEVNAGKTLLAALGAGYKYRLIDAYAISVGGAAAAVTTVDILGTQAAAGVKLVAFAQAQLTQSAIIRAGGTGGTVLADGASFVACDANAAITIGKTGSNVTTATHIDAVLTYAIDLV